MPQLNREALERPFEQVKYRDGKGGKQFAYIEGHQAVRRLDEVFGGLYSFEVMRWENLGTEIVVLAAITVRLDDGTIIRKENVGSSEIQVDKTTGEQKAFGDSYKSAVTDAFKRISAFGFGVGLYLYAGDESPHGSAPQQQPTSVRASLSVAQKNAIANIGRAKGFNDKALDEMAVKQCGRVVAELSKAEASSLIQSLQGAEFRRAG